MKYLLILTIMISCAHKKTNNKINDERELLKLEASQTISDLELSNLDRIELEDKQVKQYQQGSLEVPPLEPDSIQMNSNQNNLQLNTRVKVEDLNKSNYKNDAMIIYTPLWKQIPIRMCKKIVPNPMYVNGACVERY